MSLLFYRKDFMILEQTLATAGFYQHSEFFYYNAFNFLSLILS